MDASMIYRKRAKNASAFPSASGRVKWFDEKGLAQAHGLPSGCTMIYHKPFLQLGSA